MSRINKRQRFEEENEETQLLHRQKTRSLEMARKMFPTLHDKLKRKKDHNRAEALLIAEYCRRTTV